MNLQRIQQTLDAFNEIGKTENGVTRLAYTAEAQKAKDLFIELCKRENLSVRVDACGNVIARREGKNPNLPAVATGSHLDTVIDGGKYDGLIGVVGALEVVRFLNEEGIETEHPVEIIAFACEESSRFGVSTLGSKAMAGLLDLSVAELRDRNGISLEQAFRNVGLDIRKIGEAKRKPEELKAFIELHIEQGSVLEMNRKKVGIVTGIAAPTRLHIQVEGKASHSGSTPMGYRKDALLGAAEIALAVEAAALAEAEYGTVGTVGKFDIRPGAMNVVPGAADLYVDIRGTSTDSKKNVLSRLRAEIEEIQKKRKLNIHCETISDEEPVLLDPSITDLLMRQCEAHDIPAMKMPSGAGHDAMNMAYICPTGLIFVPSRDGLSHHPDEYTSLEDIGLGISLLVQAVSALAGSDRRYEIADNR